jgi:hypothetical protein
VDNCNQWVLLHKVDVDQGTQDLRGFEKHVRAEDNRMGFEDYKPDLVFAYKGGKHFFHKEDIDESLEEGEVVVELEDCVLPRTVGFLGKGIFHRIGRCRRILSMWLMVGSSLRLPPMMRVPSKWRLSSRREDAPQNKVSL